MQLVVRHLVLTRGGRTVIDDLSFTVGGGEALLLTGRNGAGKTTLIRALAGLLAPLSGQITIEGVPDEREPREVVHYLGHADANKGSLTVLENAQFWMRYLGDWAGAPANGAAGNDADTVWPALERLGLDGLADIPAAYLSAGQKRRLALARLLVARRPVWLLDEPSVSLDAASVALLARIIGEHVAGGGLAIAATHLPLGLDAARELRLGMTDTGAST
ncbi:MAG: heme ABC exporter ATP-binding protein CcmA [Hyphomicrobiaceae bacterium]